MGRIISLYKLTTLVGLQVGTRTNLDFAFFFEHGGVDFATLLTAFLVHSISIGFWVTHLTLLTLPLNERRKKQSE